MTQDAQKFTEEDLKKAHKVMEKAFFAGSPVPTTPKNMQAVEYYIAQALAEEREKMAKELEARLAEAVRLIKHDMPCRCAIEEATKLCLRCEFLNTPTNYEKKDPITEMDSDEFIAHVFYNVLGGLYANSEEDARRGILDMLEDRKVDKPLPQETWLLSEAQIRTHILRNWGREQIERFAKHLLGDKSQKTGGV